MRCAAGADCVDAERIDDGYLGACTSQIMCIRCERSVQYSIRELASDYVMLYVSQRVGSTPAMGELVLASKDPPVPISVNSLMLAERIAHEATAFATPVAEALGIAWDETAPARCRWGAVPRYRTGVLLSRAAHILVVALSTLLSLPAVAYTLPDEIEGLVTVELTGVACALRLAELHRIARSTLGITRHATALPVPCPHCAMHTVVRYAGSHTATCQSCGGRWSEREYQRWTIVLAYEHGG